MSEADIDSLFRELKPDVESLANPLFDASRDFVRARGAFLPHGAVLSTSGEVRLVMGLPPDSEEGQVSTRPDNAPSQRVILAYRGRHRNEWRSKILSSRL